MTTLRTCPKCWANVSGRTAYEVLDGSAAECHACGASLEAVRWRSLAAMLISLTAGQLAEADQPGLIRFGVHVLVTLAAMPVCFLVIGRLRVSMRREDPVSLRQ